ncbi:MAG: phosphate acyltransferase PlsX, partial [Anaerococcus sp.]|nr:phosphate acyltransferase PlsX [Anaerococcus sp.]
MKIIIDTYGADDGIKVPIDGAIEALKEKEFLPIFSGDKEKIEKIIDGRIKSYEIIDAKEKIENNEDPVKAIRRKKESSLVKAFNKLNEEGYHGLVSAG